MATININVPDITAGRVVHALCATVGLEESPVNAKKAVLIWIKTTVANVERSEAEQARGPVNVSDVETIVS